MHHCFTANNFLCSDTDVERSLGTDEKWGKIIQIIIYFMLYYLRNQIITMNLKNNLLWRLMGTALLSITNWDNIIVIKVYQSINLKMTYSNSQHIPTKFFQSKNHGHNTYWKAQHTQHSQLNSHKSTCLWEAQRSKPLWLWPWEVQRSGTWYFHIYQKNFRTAITTKTTS